MIKGLGIRLVMQRALERTGCDRALNELGLRTARFRNEEVSRDLSQVVGRIE